MDKVILGLQQILQTAVLAQFTADSGPLKNIKKVYFGDPIKIPETDLPSIAIQPINTDFNLRGSRYDQKNHTIELRLVQNKKAFFQTDNPADQTTVRVVKDMIEKAETVDYVGHTITESICGIIQANICLFYDDGGGAKKVAELSKIRSVSYGFNEERGFPTYEVVVTVEAIVIGDR